MTNVTVCDTVRAGMLGCYFIFGKLSQLAWSLLGPRPQLGLFQEAGLGAGSLRGDLSWDCPLAKGSGGVRGRGDAGLACLFY